LYNARTAELVCPTTTSYNSRLITASTWRRMTCCSRGSDRGTYFQILYRRPRALWLLAREH